MLKYILGSFLLGLTLQVNAAAPAVGDTPDNYLGMTIQGDDVLLENYQDKVVVVSFWASWCAPCLQEMPVLDAIQQQVGTDAMQVVAVNFKEDKKRYRKLHKVLSEASSHLVFTHDERGRIGGAYGVESLPSLFVIGKTGKVALHKIGYGESSIDSIVDVLNAELAK
ncbi:TlpA disulfide reductase family protein [Rheinheimera baltica]|uniref:TlpA disulfide reductase family protein n=1 Tax=Rheinheimera baltica TaxID=67576 RepID=A0ABT9HZ66_9GAMM|nr:TlpA disulfide reductase family protein [Rheinheimera baltica]MDP5136412.1 TlpA disulfide reductase family protein [Rheinheimera baltica]